MIISVQFFSEKTQKFSGRSYSYQCDFPVEVGNNVRVPASDGTTVGRVVQVNVPEEECGYSPRALKHVISVTENAAPGKEAEPEPEQLSLLDNLEEPEKKDLPVPEDLIVIKQLPIIEESLHQLKDDISKEVNRALLLAVTEDTVKDVKKVRADLNAKFKELETLRKEVKKRILAPYEQFELTYKSCVTDVFQPADRVLSDKINSVENGLKDAKREKIKRYYYEYAASVFLLDWVPFEECGIKITLSDSETSLKKWVKTYLDGIRSDLDAIKGMEYPEEILSEYRRTQKLSSSIQNVTDWHARVEAEKARRAQEEAERARIEEAEAKVAEAVEKPTAPQEMPPEVICAAEPEKKQEEEIFVEFRVYGTIEMLKALKKFLVDGGYKYGSI